MNLIDRVRPKKKTPLYAFNCCHQGASHLKTNKICQDFTISKSNTKYSVAVVCDGHGDDNHFRSDRGSKLAAETAIECIDEFMHASSRDKKLREQIKEKSSDYLQHLEGSFIANWRKKILQDYTDHPFSENELNLLSADARDKLEKEFDSRLVRVYGTTLIAIVVYPGHFWFGLHIGDGKCVAIREDGECYQPIPWDDNCFLNVTTSLCDENALSEFRHCFYTDNFPSAIFIASDGVDDSFANDEDLYGFYQEIMDVLKTKDHLAATSEINLFLPELSQKGSGDDISMAGIIKSE